MARNQAYRARKRKRYRANHPEKRRKRIPGAGTQFHIFRRSVERVIRVKLDLDSQVRVRRLIAEKKIAAYERLNGEIGEIGVPRNRAGGGWVFGSPKREPMKVA